jgi:hypothetical protein
MSTVESIAKLATFHQIDIHINRSKTGRKCLEKRKNEREMKTQIFSQKLCYYGSRS